MAAIFTGVDHKVASGQVGAMIFQLELLRFMSHFASLPRMQTISPCL